MTCSDAWQSLPALGTAPTSRYWLALEQNGAWGAKALIESDLDPAIGEKLTSLADHSGGHVVLVRDPVSHAAKDDGPRRVLLAGGPLDDYWVGTATVDDPADLVGMMEDWLAGDLDRMPTWAEPTGPLLLVCTNGKRDQCCAVKGRAVAKVMAAEFPGRVWESSHLHGHRFAATALALPSTQMYARIDEDLARRVLTEGAPIPVGAQHDRGRTLLTEPLQVADTLVREQLPAHDQASLEFEGPNARGEVTVLNRTDRRTWRVRVSQEEVAGPLPKSCAKGPERASIWQGELL